MDLSRLVPQPVNTFIILHPGVIFATLVVLVVVLLWALWRPASTTASSFWGGKKSHMDGQSVVSAVAGDGVSVQGGSQKSVQYQIMDGSNTLRGAKYSPRWCASNDYWSTEAAAEAVGVMGAGGEINLGSSDNVRLANGYANLTAVDSGTMSAVAGMLNGDDNDSFDSRRSAAAGPQIPDKYL